METDLDTIRTLARERESENFAFVAFLKACIDSRVDAVVGEVQREVSAAIDCRQCANCCRRVRPVFDLEDLVRFSAGISQSPDRFKERYFVPGKDRLLFKAPPCPFLSGNLCANYAHRPKTCSAYPHLHEADFSYRLTAVIDHLSICPIIFNVFERLKGLGRGLSAGVRPSQLPPFASLYLR